MSVSVVCHSHGVAVPFYFYNAPVDHRILIYILPWLIIVVRTCSSVQNTHTLLITNLFCSILQANVGLADLMERSSCY